MTKNKFNPDIHHRRSVRLKDYDYSQDGAYFVTVCVQNKACLFGEIVDGVMCLNDAGKMVERWWLELKMKFTALEIDAFTIMPNHFHGIIMIVGADIEPARNNIVGTVHEADQNNTVGAALCGRPDFTGGNQDKEGQPHRVAPTLGTIMDWFKTMTTNEYIRHVKQDNWPSFPGKLWQRNYHERIIRNDDELNRIREYIMYNPARWAEDEDNPANIQ